MNQRREISRKLESLRRGLLNPYAAAAPPTPAGSAAILVPIFESRRDLHVVFIRRSEHVRSHRGQVAFPGGRVDPADPSVVAAALREAQEEVGIEPKSVNLLGGFPAMRTTTSGITVASFAGLIPRTERLRANPDEVAEIFTVPLSVLGDPAMRGSVELHRDGVAWTYPAIMYQDKPIWGLTYRITLNLLELME